MTLISGPAATPLWLAIAELDRTAWLDSPDAAHVPDGEHAWRVWVEYSFVAAVLDDDSQILGALCGIDTAISDLHFLHKIFVAPERRGSGIGGRLIGEYVRHLDLVGKRSILTTSPANAPMQRVAERHGFSALVQVRGYYRPSEDRLLMARPLPNTTVADFSDWRLAG